MGKWKLTLTLAGLAGLLVTGSGAAPRDAWSEAVAYFQQRGGSKKPEERATAASKLADGMDGKHDRLATGFLVALLTTELNREDGGRKEDQVSGDVLRNCQDSLRKASMAEAVDILIREAKKNRSTRARFLFTRVLGGLKGETAGRALVELVEDKELLVVIGAADGLRDRADESTLDALLKLLKRKDCPWEASIACFDALEKINKPDKCMDELLQILEAMKADAGRTKSRLIQVLARLCGIPEAATSDAAWWKDAWAAKKEGKEADKPAPVADTLPTEFYGLSSLSTRMVFLVDISSTMDTPYAKPPAGPAKPVDPKKPDEVKKGTAGARKGDALEDAAKARAGDLRKKQEARPVRRKMDDVKRELSSTLYALDPRVSFTVIWFDNEPRAWKEELVPATWQNKLACLQETEKVSANGASGTNLWGALEFAFRFAANPQKPELIQPDKKGNYATLLKGADTFFLVSGGEHNTGKYMIEGANRSADVSAFQAELEKVTTLRRVNVHTAALGDVDNENDFLTDNAIRFLKKIAQVTDGQSSHNGLR